MLFESARFFLHYDERDVSVECLTRTYSAFKNCSPNQRSRYSLYFLSSPYAYAHRTPSRRHRLVSWSGICRRSIGAVGSGPRCCTCRTMSFARRSWCSCAGRTRAPALVCAGICGSRQRCRCALFASDSYRWRVVCFLVMTRSETPPRLDSNAQPGGGHVWLRE